MTTNTSLVAKNAAQQSKTCKKKPSTSSINGQIKHKLVSESDMPESKADTNNELTSTTGQSTTDQTVATAADD